MSQARQRTIDFNMWFVVRFAVTTTLLLSLLSCSFEQGRVTTPPSAIPSATTSPTPTPTPSTAAAALTLHWMSFETPIEPRYRLLYEGGGDVGFTEVRLLAPDGSVVAQATAVPTATEVMRMCGRSLIYGPLRATLAVPTQSVLADVIRRPDAYRVEARIAGEWKAAGLVNECHGQV